MRLVAGTEHHRPDWLLWKRAAATCVEDSVSAFEIGMAVVVGLLVLWLIARVIVEKIAPPSQK